MNKYLKILKKIFNKGWKCPNCGGINTISDTYYDECNDCGYFQSY